MGENDFVWFTRCSVSLLDSDDLLIWKQEETTHSVFFLCGVMFKATETVYFKVSHKKKRNISYITERFHKISIKAVKCCVALL